VTIPESQGLRTGQGERKGKHFGDGREGNGIQEKEQDLEKGNKLRYDRRAEGSKKGGDEKRRNTPKRKQWKGKKS